MSSSECLIKHSMSIKFRFHFLGTLHKYFIIPFATLQSSNVPASHTGWGGGGGVRPGSLASWHHGCFEDSQLLM